MLASRNQPFQYIIYRFPWGQVDFTNGQNIIAIISGDPNLKNELTFFDNKGNDTNLYAVTASDCFNYQKPNVVVEKPTKPPVTQTTKKKKTPWWKGFWRRVFGK